MTGAQISRPGNCPLCRERTAEELRADVVDASREMQAAGEAERAWLDYVLTGQPGESRDRCYRELRAAIIRHEAARKRRNRAEAQLERGTEASA